MITRDLLKNEIDKIQDQYLGVLYKIIQAFLMPNQLPDESSVMQNSSWDNFIEQTYGSLADDPIERGDQGKLEIREAIQ